MAIENLDRRLAAGIRWSFLGLGFFLPLLVSTRSSEVFELPKILFVYAAAAVIVGLWLGRMLVRREILIRRTPLDFPILLFLISQMASTIYSIDPHVSWWGWYGRFHGGLVSTISYTLLYYALVSNIQIRSTNIEIRNKSQIPNDKNPKRYVSKIGILNFEFVSNFGFRVSNLILVILSSALFVSIYAILQHFGIDKNFWVQDVVNRVFSTQGQPNWLAAYLVMTMPIAIIFTNICQFPINTNKPMKKNNWVIGLLGYWVIGLFFTALLFTKSRSGLLGFAVADIVFWSAILVNRFNSSSRVRSKTTNREIQRSDWNISIASARFLGFARNDGRHFLTIHFLMATLVLATNNPIRETLFKNGIATSSADWRTPRNDGIPRKSEFGGTESGDIRRLVWSGALKIAKQNPVFGTGPETFGETYWRVRPKEHNLTSEWNFLYNKAHNEWLNLAANTGLFGLGSHILLLGWFSIWMLKGPTLPARPAGGPRQGRTLSDAILAAIVGVEAVNFFGFSTTTVGAYRYLFMAIAITAVSGGANKLLKRPPDRAGSSVIFDKVILAALALFILYIIFQIFIFFSADLSYNRGRAYQDAGYVEEAAEPLMRAVNLVPGEPVFRAELAEAEGALAATLTAKLTENGEQRTENSEIILELKNDAMANFEIVRRQSPQNLGFIRTQARILFLLGEQDKAVSLMMEAMAMAPTNPQLPYSLGQMLSKMGQTEEAALYYNKAVELKPDYPAAIKILNTE